MKTILLTRDLKADLWLAAELVDGQRSPELMAHFGTHILPTAFTAAASGREVYAKISKLNPEARVLIIVE